VIMRPQNPAVLATPTLNPIRPRPPCTSKRASPKPTRNHNAGKPIKPNTEAYLRCRSWSSGIRRRGLGGVRRYAAWMPHVLLGEPSAVAGDIFHKFHLISPACRRFTVARGILLHDDNSAGLCLGT